MLRRVRKKLAKLLAKRKRLTALLTVTARDASGNAATQVFNVALKQ